MTALQRVARFSDRIFDRLRDKRAFTVTDEEAADGDFSSLRGHKYAVVVTFRRHGEAVPSPAWFALDDQGRAYVLTAPHAGKVKRLRRDSRVVLAPSSLRGRPEGPAVRGTGRILPEAEWARAEEALAAAYGLGRKMFQRVLGGPAEMRVYLEITPGR